MICCCLLHISECHSRLSTLPFECHYRLRSARRWYYACYSSQVSRTVPPSKVQSRHQQGRSNSRPGVCRHIPSATTPLRNSALFSKSVAARGKSCCKKPMEEGQPSIRSALSSRRSSFPRPSALGFHPSLNTHSHCSSTASHAAPPAPSAPTSTRTPA